MKIQITVSDSKIQAVSPYNPELPSRAKDLGGRWNGSAWVFDARDEQRVRELYRDIYGTDGTDAAELVTIRVTVLRNDYADKTSLFLAGRQIARATGRDSGARLGDGVVVLDGQGFDSGGSRANWTTKVIEGTVFEIRDIPKAAVEVAIKAQAEYSSPYYKIEILEQEKSRAVDVEALKAERERLVARIAEIDSIVEQAELPTPASKRQRLTCKSCSQSGYTGSYPFSTLPSSSLCDDCV